ncbi:MAG: DEAD/DEAH box helicase [Candidatus Omnitrophota bacterium]|jgi:superfamily II RNA helicase
MIYDPFQQESIDYINNGYSVIVSAPTGAGKTAIAEHIITSCLEANMAVIYTSPIKALSNQKFRDFLKQYKDSVGILTGDISLNADAPVLIMTTEIFRNKVLSDPESLQQYSWVIFDEVHYIDNPQRGTVWEESLIFMPEHMNILCLSATIPNINEFAAWLESIHGKQVKTVIEEKRPVPLHFFYQCQNQIVDRIEHLRKTHHVRVNKLFALVEHIQQKNGFPCIYFVFGRKKAEELAWEMSGFNFLNPEEQHKISSMYSDLCGKYDLKTEKSAIELIPLVKRGIAYHHAGMLPTLKETIEQLFTSRLLKLIFTTETFALGINMPSRSVIFDQLQKYYGHYQRNLKTRDFYQMAGRAGRRGLDKEGFVYCRVNPFKINFGEVNRIIYGPPEKVNSQFNTSYATILNLYEKHGDRLVDIYPRSFHYFQSKKNEQREAVRLMEAKIKLLKDLNYIENGNLSVKGQFAKCVYGYEMLITELYDRKFLEGLDEFGLGILTAAVVFEPRKNQSTPILSKRARAIKRACEEVYDSLRQKESKYKIYPFSKQAYFHLSQAMEYWLQGTDFSKIMRYTDTDEGEIVRYFRMCVQTLREIHEAMGYSVVLTDKLQETIRMINRDVVDAARQLGEL